MVSSKRGLSYVEESYIGIWLEMETMECITQELILVGVVHPNALGRISCDDITGRFRVDA